MLDAAYLVQLVTGYRTTEYLVDASIVELEIANEQLLDEIPVEDLHAL